MVQIHNPGRVGQLSLLSSDELARVRGLVPRLQEEAEAEPRRRLAGTAKIASPDRAATSKTACLAYGTTPLRSRTFTTPAPKREGGLLPCPGRRWRMSP
jgi:hypothetical protein